MATPSRAAQIAKLQKVLRKHYNPVVPAAERSVLEHLLFACCLENAYYPAAEESLAALVHNFFDWNEVRVSTVRELGEAMPNLPDPSAAAGRVRRVLQSVFESTYTFALDEVKKQNLKPAVECLEKIDGVTRFCLDYVVHAALGGHAIPLDSGAFGVLKVVDLATDKDIAAKVVPGLERAVPKNEGAEFASLLHQLGAEFVANPYSHALHAILLEIDPTAKDRLPSRRAAKKAETPVAPEKGKKAESKPVAKAAEPSKAASKEAAKTPAKPGVVGKSVPAKEPVSVPAKEPVSVPTKEPVKGKAAETVPPAAKQSTPKEVAKVPPKKRAGEELPTSKPAADTSQQAKGKAKDKTPVMESIPAKNVEPPPTKGFPKKKPDAAKAKSGDGSASEVLAKRKPR